MVLLLSIVGFVLLTVGAEWLVRGASQLARLFGIPPFIVGLTIVAFATGSPELAVSILSAVADKPDITIGNVLGSNILNVFFVLGIASIVAKRLFAQRNVRMDVLTMIAVSALLWRFAWTDSSISRVEGIIFLVIFTAYTWFNVIKARKKSGETKDAQTSSPEGTAKQPSAPKSIVLILVGLGALILGAHWLVNGAVFVAEWFGISELIIGLTIVALGTSLPEVAASVMACIKNEQDIAVGNVLGSNLFNILAVIGVAAIISSNGVPVNPDAVQMDIPVMLMAALACLPLCFSTRGIHRWEGVVFLLYYGAYAALLVYKTSHPEVLKNLDVLLWFFIPLVIITLIALFFRFSTRNKAATS